MDDGMVRTDDGGGGDISRHGDTSCTLPHGLEGYKPDIHHVKGNHTNDSQREGGMYSLIAESAYLHHSLTHG